MKLNPLSLVKTILHFTGYILGGIFIPVHQRVQQRKALAATPTPISTIPLSPAEITVLPIELVEIEPAQLEPTDTIPAAPTQPPAELSDPETETVEPVPDRQQLVIALLDEAHSIGHTTYPALIAYVKKHSGTGCSRRVVSAWKRSRNLMGEEAA